MRHILLFASAFVLTSCHHVGRTFTGIPPEALAPIAKCGEPSGHLRVVTMNAGLASGVVSMANARTPDFASGIAQFRDADVICLQEVWKEEAVDAVRDALALAPNQFYRVDTRGQNEEPGRFTCTDSQISGLAKCAREKCSGEDTESQTICTLRNCRVKLGMLKYFGGLSCLNCLAASAGKSIDEIIGICTSKEGASRVYDGQNGVILASKWPLKNTAYKTLPSSAVNRVALFATVEVPGRGPIEVACTHLTSPENEVNPTNQRFKSWEEEQTAQFHLIADELKQRAGNRSMLLVGDLNTGVVFQKDGRVTYEPVWDEVLLDGFDDPVSRVRPPMCTMCSTNITRGGGTFRSIDHVLTSRRDRSLVPICGRQILTGRKPYVQPDGSTVDLECSDHYGVEVDFQ